MTTARLQLPEKLRPVFEGDYRYRCAHGGRGSGKTRTFAKMAAVKAVMLSQAGKRGVIVCARLFMNSLADSSFAEIKSAVLSEDWLVSYFDIGEKYIRTADGLIEFSFVGLARNVDSIKSKSQIHVFWVDEAEPVPETAWQKIDPTVREAGSELWVTWNPERKNSATHMRFRQNPPSDCITVECNWQDNPWFPTVLDKVRQNDFNYRPEQYAHIWDGDFVTVVEGAYFAKPINVAQRERRIGRVAADPLMSYRAYWDIGGTGAKADATAIWISQFIGKEIRILDYYEAQGQTLATHIQWLRDSGYGKALCKLPHDGGTNDKVHDVSFESYLRAAGFVVDVIPNQGRGAAMMRVEAARRLFPSMWFNEETTRPGLDAIGWYHEKRDEERGIGLGPDHDWSSHAADAFGMMAMDYKEPTLTKPTDYSIPQAPSWAV